MNETNMRVCKTCLKLKQRIQDGKFPNNRDKRYIDDDGKKWNGSKCGTCHAEQVAQRTREKRQTSRHIVK